jgi:glutathione-regulated potassium-efflux system ancillary protein KefG
VSKTLFVIAHPDLQNSRANKAVLSAVQNLPDVTVHDLYAHYPDFKIDVAAEQALLVAHDAIVLQFPFYWYASPALLKEWLDVVWTWGFAFGPNGNALQDKKIRLSITTGSPADAYSPEGANSYTLTELLRPFELTARLCKMDYTEPYTINWAKRISDDELAAQVAGLVAML